MAQGTLKPLSFITFWGLTMKKLTIALVLATALCLGLSLRRTPKQNPITPERRATHMLSYYADKSDEPSAFCTGTIVGPHALLTAMHCDTGDITIISLDLSVRKYNIIGIIYDGRDHVIYHLDGPAFKNIVTIHEREAVLGESVTSYGDGHRDFPQHTYFGKVIVDDNGGDTSEVDLADGVRCFSIPVVPGDSGSAVYGADGSIVAVVTYGGTNEETGVQNAVGFALAFTPEELEKIKN